MAAVPRMLAPTFSTASTAALFFAATLVSNRSCSMSVLAWTTTTTTTASTIASRRCPASSPFVRSASSWCGGGWKEQPKESRTSITTATPLYSTVAPKNEDVSTPSSSSTVSSSSSSSSSPSSPSEEAAAPAEVVVAEGTVVSYFAGGLAAVHVSSDRNDGVTMEVDKQEEDALGTGSHSSDDLIGRKVIFSNNKNKNGTSAATNVVGMVVAHRPPLVFCYTTMMDDDDDDDDVTNNNDNKQNDQAMPIVEGRVQILEGMAQVHVHDAMGMVDCFGRPLQLLDDDDDDSASTHATEDDKQMTVTTRDIFATIPQVSDIALINCPLLTGETMVDALAPIGKGQNMLVIASDNSDMQTDMQGLADDICTAQTMSTTTETKRTTKCIYAVTHDTGTVLERLKGTDLLDDLIVVSVRNNNDNDGNNDDNDKTVDPASKAAEAVAVSATACAIGETFALEEGRDALVIIDTIDDFKVLWDATTRVLVHVFGVDAVVKDDRNGGASSEMRAFYSSLFQRAAQYKDSKGGGSVTLVLLASIPSSSSSSSNDDDGSTSEEEFVHQVSEFDDCSDKIKARLDVLVKNNIPLTAANLRKIDIPIPTLSEGRRRLALQHVEDLISMSDGQIWFDEQLAKQGQCPPMDPQRSITRVGIGADTESRADAPAIRRMVEGLRLDLAQAASMDGAEATVASSKQLRKRNAWLLAMYQKPGRGGRTLAESCVALLAASIGALDDTIDGGGLAGTDGGQSTMRDLIAHVETVAPDAINEINDTLDISPTRRNELVDAIHSFFS